MSGTPYRQPILAFILRVFGILAAVVATLAFGAIVASLASGNGTAGVLAVSAEKSADLLRQLIRAYGHEPEA